MNRFQQTELVGLGLQVALLAFAGIGFIAATTQLPEIRRGRRQRMLREEYIREHELEQERREREARFEYRYLDSKSSAIRLLTIHPSEAGTSPLSCSLEHVSLLEAPPYAALSYCWGKPGDEVRITLGGRIAQVTTNLHSALKRLRDEGVTRVWVDALCINQRDDEEKSRQVRRMGNIFRQANQVVVWLGDAQDITEAAINPLSSENATETLSNSVQRVFFTLLSKSYWTRVWIIQELAEASKITVLCGHYNLLWEGLESFSRSTFTPSFDGADGGELKAKFQELLQFRIDRLSIKPVSLLELLYRSRSACSTDPRDKIYGLLGLAYDSHVYVPEPNYNLSVEETYTKFSRTFIEKGYPLDLIYLRSSRRGIHESLPSWVVDWQDLNDALAKQEFEHILASVRRSTQSFPPTLSSQPSFSSYNLTVSGAILRTIDGVGSALSADGSHFTASGKTAKNRSSSVPADYDHSTYIFNALLETQKQPSATTNPPPNPIGLWSCEPAKLEKYLCGPVEPRLEALSKWIDANSSFTALGKTMKIWDNIWTSQQVSTDRDSRRDNTGHDIDLCGLAATILSGMRIATLETGELGWVHPQSQEGDKISKIFGCSRYVVLRPVVKGFRVIGEARVSWFAGKPELSKRENLILT